MDPFATHLPLLAEAIMRTSGDVLEVGMGEYSTPVLHALCLRRRRLVSIETDLAWAKRFFWLRNSMHQLLCVRSYENCHWLDRPGWDVALVDHAPGYIRVRDIRRLAKHAKYIVIHDTEDVSYGYEAVLSQFPHRYDYTELSPRTTIVSMTTPFP